TRRSSARWARWIRRARWWTGRSLELSLRDLEEDALEIVLLRLHADQAQPLLHRVLDDAREHLVAALVLHPVRAVRLPLDREHRGGGRQDGLDVAGRREHPDPHAALGPQRLRDRVDR